MRVHCPRHHPKLGEVLTGEGARGNLEDSTGGADIGLSSVDRLGVGWDVVNGEEDHEP
jgi:hypothetical protein